MKGVWTREHSAGHEIAIYQPPGAVKPRFACLFLHDLEAVTLEGQTDFTRWFDEFNMPCIGPFGRSSWWVDRPCAGFASGATPEQHLCENVLPLIQKRWGVAPRAIGLLGIGMGGQGVVRLAFKQARLFPVVAAIAPALDYHELYGQGTPLDDIYESKEQCRQDTALLHIPPYDGPPHIFFCADPNDLLWFRGNDRLHEKMTALGVAHTLDLTTAAGGHSRDYFNHQAERALRFLHAGLEHESRRLL